MVSSTPWPLFTPGIDRVPIVQEAGWAPGPVWTGRKSRPHRDSISDHPARSQSLYRLSYPAREFICAHTHTYARVCTHTCVCTYIHMRTHTYMHAHTNTCVRTYIHVHTRTYIRARACTHTHTSNNINLIYPKMKRKKCGHCYITHIHARVRAHIHTNTHPIILI